MFSYILKRLLLMIPTLFGILLLTFVVIQFVPGGPVEQMVSQLQGRDTGGEGAAASGAGYRGRQGVDAARIEEIKQLYGFDKGKGHGPAWKKVMRAIGQAPERCHSYDVSGVVKGHAYKCSSCGKDFHLTTHRHNKILRGSTYHCTATSACRSSRLVKA